MQHPSFRNAPVGRGRCLWPARWRSGRSRAQAREPSKPDGRAPPATTPVSVAVVEQRDVATVGRVLRPSRSGRARRGPLARRRRRAGGAFPRGRAGEGGRPAGHDRSGALRRRGRARRGAGGRRRRRAWRSPRSELERGQQLVGTRAPSRNASSTSASTRMREAEANLRAAQAALQSAGSTSSYTEVRAPVAGRVGKLEITVGNLVAAGPGAPVLTTLVSVDPIYASFNADEEVVTRALAALGADATRPHADRAHPGRDDARSTSNGTPFHGQLQLIDNQVDARSGTVRVRAVFDNADGTPDARAVRAAAHGPGQDRAGAAGQRARDRHRPGQEIRAWSSTPTTRRPIAR